MNGKDAIVRAMEGDRDVQPAAIFTQTATVSQMQNCGCFWPDAIYDPDKMVELSLQPNRMFGFSCARIPFNTNSDSEVFGCEINRGDEKIPPSVRGSPYMGDCDFVDAPEDFIGVDEFMSSERITSILEAAEKLSKHEEVFSTTSLNGPVAAIDNIVGMENVLMVSMMEPERVTKWLGTVTPHITELGRALSEVSDNVMFIEESDTEIFMPDMFDMMIGDFLPKVISAASGSFTTIHSCGNTFAIADKLASLGETALSPEASSDPTGYVEAVGGKAVLVGCVNPVQALMLGTPEDVVREARASAEAGFGIIAPECGVPPTASDENLLALFNYRAQ